MVAKSWFVRQWRILQYAAAGVVEGLCANDHRTRGTLQTPPESVLNKKGAATVLLFALFLISMNIFILIVNKISSKNKKAPFTLDDLEALLNEKCFQPQGFSEWFELECIYQDIDISFQEQYHFYRMYRKLANRYVVSGELTELPPGLDRKLEDVHKNFLITKISGMDGEM